MRASTIPPRMDIRLNSMPTRIRWGAILGASSAVKAGKARINSMSPEEKSKFQSDAAKARWAKYKKEINGIRSQSSEQLRPSPGVTYSESYGVSVPCWQQRSTLPLP